MIGDHDALLKAVIENPDDDTARLAFADWCMENGQHSRGRFIVCQVAEAALEGSQCTCRESVMNGASGDCPLSKLEEAKSELYTLPPPVIETIGEGLLDELLDKRDVQDTLNGHAMSPGWDWPFRRGFIDSATLTLYEWVSHQKALRAQTPLRHLNLRLLLALPPGGREMLTWMAKHRWGGIGVGLVRDPANFHQEPWVPWTPQEMTPEMYDDRVDAMLMRVMGQRMAEEIDNTMQIEQAVRTIGNSPPTLFGLPMTFAPSELETLASWSRATPNGGYLVPTEFMETLASRSRVTLRERFAWHMIQQEYVRGNVFATQPSNSNYSSAWQSQQDWVRQTAREWLQRTVDRVVPAVMQPGFFLTGVNDERARSQAEEEVAPARRRRKRRRRRRGRGQAGPAAPAGGEVRAEDGPPVAGS